MSSLQPVQKKPKANFSFKCSKCNLDCYSQQSLAAHSRWCIVPDGKQTVTFTQGGIQKAVRDGGFKILNNGLAGHAYSHQLHHHRSLKEQCKDLQRCNDVRSVDDDSINPSNDDMSGYGDDVSFDNNNDDFSDEFSSDDDDDCKHRETTARYKEFKDKIPFNLESDELFEYKDTMGTSATAFTELLMICHKHGANKQMYDDIQHWVTAWSLEHPNVFRPSGQQQVWSRKKLLAFLKDVFSCKKLEPTIHNVELHDGRIVSVPEVDFAESMRSILNDSNVMKHVMKGLDPETWRPIVSEDIHEQNPDAQIYDKDSGFLYRLGIKNHCPDPSDCDPKKVRPFPVLIHIDKSHSDVFGNLAVAPIQMMPAMIDVEYQQKVCAWRQTGTVPNLSAGKGADGKDSRSAINKLKDYHKVVHAALTSFRKCYEDGGFLWVDKKGEEILLKPYVHCFIGDIAGVNEMIGHYNNCSANCLAKDCKCAQDDILQFPPKCKQMRWLDLQACTTVDEIFQLYADKGLVSERDMCRVRHDPDFAKSISKHCIDNAFDKLPLADPYQGIIGMTPQEMLHMMGGGIFKYIISGIKDIIGENQTNQRLKKHINDIFPDIREYLNRNAEKDVSRMSNRNGFFNLTNLTSDEVRGNLYGLIVLMHTTYGKELFEAQFQNKGVDYETSLETCLLLLSWEQFHLRAQTRQDIERSESVTWDLQERIIRDIPRSAKEKTKKSAGSKGWQIVKFHSIGFIPALNLKFGCGRCYDTSSNEKNHKEMVKKNAKLTQRIQSRFSTQLSRNDHDRITIETAYQHIAPFLPTTMSLANDESSATSDQSVCENNDDFRMSGSCRLTIDIDARKRITVSHRWKNRTMKLLGIQPNPYVGKTIADQAITYNTKFNMPQTTSLTVETFTRAVVKGVAYRCNPYWKGSTWYDWGRVQFPNGGGMCVCRIMGFFQYLTPGSLTYKNIEVDELLPDDFHDAIDETIYVVLHCQTTYFSMQHLETSFIRKFSMTNANEMYVLPASCIEGPLLVVPDIIDKDTISESNFMAICPKRKMGLYYLHHINWYHENNDHSDSDSDDNDQASNDDGSEVSTYSDDW